MIGRFAIGVSIWLLAWAAAMAEANRPMWKVWQGQAPGESGDVGEEHVLPPRGIKPVTRITNVTRPTVTVFPAPEEKATGAAVLICPGGGYHILAYDLEGEEVAEWLNSIGVTAFLLKYRVPRRKDRPKHEAPLQDVQRALSQVRSQAKKWKIDPERIGILGFSAGGHLSATASTNFDKRAYEAIDEVDNVSCRPDFAVLVYPAYLTAEQGLAPEIRVGPQTPPMILIHAHDDRISPENSVALYLALKRAKVPAELHIYTSGGHGFGLRPSQHPCSTWPQRCADWLASRGLLAQP